MYYFESVFIFVIFMFLVYFLFNKLSCLQLIVVSAETGSLDI